MIDLNEYLSVSPGANTGEKICETVLKESLLNSMPNSCSSQEYVQGFECESIT